MRALLVGAMLLGGAAPAIAEVKLATPVAIELEHRMELPVPPARAFQALAALPQWWSDAHTYSGKATNLRLDLRAGGCWCEALPNGGGVEHMRVAYVDPGKSLTLTGSLGPLLTQATSGVMQWTVKPSAGGSQIVMNYRVAGFYNGGADKLAPLVDGVLGEQMKRLAAHAAKAPR
jgi:uncharacterized protein YndB with AHSA1/START domain